MKASGETKLLLITGAFVLVGGLILVFLNSATTPGGKLPFTSPTPTPTPIAWTPEKFDSLIKDARHVRGDAKAPVTIVEFADFECPSCRLAYNNTIVKWEQSGKPMRFVFRHFPWPYHQKALPAARAAEAAGKQGKFWEMYDNLFYGVDTDLSDETIADCAKKIGLDMARFNKDRTDPALTTLIEADEELGKKLGINSTPTFVMRDATGKITSVAGHKEASTLLENASGAVSGASPGASPVPSPTTP